AYPSKYEGFGMPVLEAFANNCPVCLSNSSSLPEVAGDAATFFNPDNIESIKTAIEKIIYDEKYSSIMIEKGKKRLTHFSWEKCANQTVLSYKKLIA
ncbi:MAG: glycosyltransferase, partial [Ginsengibacter sp.]